VTKWVFQLIALELVCLFGILVAVGLGKLDVPIRLLMTLVPSIFAQIVGLGFIVAKYLFDASNSKSMQDLIRSSLGMPAESNRGAHGKASVQKPEEKADIRK
jgi:hypothetical protein